MKRIIQTAALYAAGFAVVLLTSCSGGKPTGKFQESETPPEIISHILTESSSFYYLDTGSLILSDATLPIGVFDSGTGGLTVLEAILNSDAFNNVTGLTGSDNIPDFRNERFTYLADQANMPYGVYYSQGKSDLLVEHIIKDVQFLLADRYYPSEESTAYISGKKPVKAIVIACNTATAYGMSHIDIFIERAGLNLKVFGVIDAGTRGALQCFEPNEEGTVGVLATVGTVASDGYGIAVARIMEEWNYKGNIMVYSQGGHGIAEAVDEEPDFINRALRAPRNNYRGPSLNDSVFPINRDLMDVYNFDFSDGKMLSDGDDYPNYSVLQINDPENYIRFHLVSLLETMRESPGSPPMKALILGCTHYPYLTAEINQVLTELYNYRKDNEYVYRHLLAEEVELIDPSVNLARELYGWLRDASLHQSDSAASSGHKFYISVPNTHNESVELDENNRFTFRYKYGRNAGEIQEYVKVVPFSEKNISEETLSRLQKFTPSSYMAILDFWGGTGFN